MNFADLSHHNPDPINWKVYRASRDRVVLKATEATAFIDPKFKERWNNTLGKRLAYHFQRVGFNAQNQLGHFLAVLRDAGFDKSKDWLVLDYEDIDTAGYLTKARSNAIQFCELAAEAGFQNGLIYSYRRYINDTGLVANDLPPGWRRLWIATYTAGLADTEVGVPNGWNRNQIVARQYTDKASVAGVTGICDDNRVIIEWMGKINTPPVGDWWDTVDDATAKNLMMDAVRDVFSIRDKMNVPFGQQSNDGFFANATSAYQQNFNAVGDLKNLVKANTLITGDDEAKILAALDEAEKTIIAVLGHSDVAPTSETPQS